MPLGEATAGRRDEDSLGLEQEVAFHPGQQLQNPNISLLSSSFPLTYIHTTKVFYAHTVYTI